MADNNKKKRWRQKGDRGGDSKRPRYQSSWAASLQAMRNGQAILFTCDVGRENKAAKELSVILERFMEEDRVAAGGGGKESTSSDEEDQEDTQQAASTTATGGSVRDSLQAEIAELKQEKAKGAKVAMMTVETGCKGTAGVSIPKDSGLDPVGACLRILEEARAGHSSSRLLIKLMPMERICFGGDLESVKQQLRDLLDQKGVLPKEEEETPATTKDDAEKPKYMVSLTRRNHAGHTRDEILGALGKAVGERWKVDLKAPEHVILMEAIKGTIGFSFCPRFNELEKYNLRRVQDQARGGGGEATAGGKGEGEGEGGGENDKKETKAAEEEEAAT